jgi:uncharacterized protein YmfQ (DUF2313 family)
MAVIIIEVPDDLSEQDQRISAAVVSDAIARLTEAGLRKDQIASLLAATERVLTPPKRDPEAPQEANTKAVSSSIDSFMMERKPIQAAEKSPEWTRLIRITKRLQGLTSREFMADPDYRSSVDAVVDILELIPACYKNLIEACEEVGTSCIRMSRSDWRAMASETDLDNEERFCFLDNTVLSSATMKSRVDRVITQACVREDASALSRIWAACDNIPLEIGDPIQGSCSDATAAVSVLSRERQALLALEAGTCLRQIHLQVRIADAGVSFMVTHEWIRRIIAEGLVCPIETIDGDLKRL